MTLATSTLRPGLLVSLGTSLSGNVKYDRIDLEEELADNRERTKWETTREIADYDEYEAAKKAQSKAAGIVRAVCAKSKFGLLCPEANKDKLDEAVAAAQVVIDEFNRTATLTHIECNVFVGHIASDDVEAVKKINREVTQLIDRLRDGVANCDPAVIREAAKRAKEVSGILSEDAQVRIQTAIDTARKVATSIVKAGEGAALVIDQLAVRRIIEQRTAFLDLSEPVEIRTPEAQGRTIDFGPQDEAKVWADWREGGNDDAV